MVGAVWDLECDGFNPTKIHCISVQTPAGLKSTANYGNMRKFFNNADVLIGHNIARFDVPIVERLLGIKVKARIVDTLALSWYLEPDRVRHGLGDYGEEFGIPKPVVTDWDGLTTAEYIHRCEEDVKINTMLWEKQWKQLLRLYGSEEEAWRLIDYLSFKMDCAREQEARKWKLDIPRATKVLGELTTTRENKVVELASVMPKVPVISKRTRPAKPFKQDGSWSVTGTNWFNLLLENNLENDFDGVVEVVTGYKEPNPGSVPQLKAWLDSFGWIPETFEFKRNKETGDVRKIPQINIKNSGGMICPSIHKLFDVEPKLKVLEGLSILTHRISILNGFLENVDEDGYIQARIQGLTNTLRFKHQVVVNLPGVDKPYGIDIRGCLIAPEGYELLGSDMCSLEDRTKQHYMWKFDPDYVKEMMTPDFDPHVDLAVFAKAMKPNDAHDFKNATPEFKLKPLYKALGALRKTYKQVNYSCVYGAGGATVGRSAGVSTNKGEKLVAAYWERNWSVKAIAEDCTVKQCNGRKWLYNPVSRLWYSLRYEKDRFSTLNQGTGVYCFDEWVRQVRSKGLPIIGQMHDEIIGLVRKGIRERAISVCKWAVGEVNKVLKLSRELDVDVQFGNSYAEIH
tara:strand:+ start:37895 stop:39772 length:1878 start_codon:yes stop_codon:yes gene_type:complete